MINSSPPKIAAISMLRDDEFFAPRWINYYGMQLGHDNLFLILDGLDQPLPSQHERINVIKVPGKELPRAKGDRNRAGIVSSFARALFQRYDIVIAHDIDEILVLDPQTGLKLSEYLGHATLRASISALGLDVGQHLDNETAIDPSLPYLEQRSFAHVSARYTKAVVATRPVNWGSGFHRVRGKNLYIDPQLYLFHFGMVDYDKSARVMDDEALLKAGWKGHLNRRYELFDLIQKNNPLEGDDFFKKARRRQQLFRPLYATNKPGMLKEKPIIRIPERFKSIV
jgi:hypothetical protein